MFIGFRGLGDEFLAVRESEMALFTITTREDNVPPVMPLTRRTSLIILICLWSVPLWCQGTLEDQLNSAYTGKILLLRNFYSGSDLRYDQNGTLISGGSPGPWMLANVEVTGFTRTAQEVEIAGNRLGTVYKGEKREFLRVGKLKIRLALPSANADSTGMLKAVLSNIFIRPGEDLRPMLPDYWRYYLSGTDSPSRVSAWQTAVEKATGILLAPGARTGGLTAPKPISTPDPKYTKAAAAQRIEGQTTLRTIIAASGTPEFIAIVQPLGMGLDEQAVAALARWKFRPSTSNRQPVPVPMGVEITFKCCP